MALVYVIVFATALGQQAWLYGVSGIGPSRAGVFINLIPVSSLLLSLIILGESFDVVKILGIILVGNSPERCRLSLQIEMRPGQTLAPTLHDLLQLGGVKAEADGSYHLRLGGTLARPILR